MLSKYSQNIRVAGLHVGYMDKDMTASITAPKSNPADIAKIAIDGIEQDVVEILSEHPGRRAPCRLHGHGHDRFDNRTQVNPRGYRQDRHRRYRAGSCRNSRR